MSLWKLRNTCELWLVWLAAPAETGTTSWISRPLFSVVNPTGSPSIWLRPSRTVSATNDVFTGLGSPSTGVFGQRGIHRQVAHERHAGGVDVPAEVQDGLGLVDG